MSELEKELLEVEGISFDEESHTYTGTVSKEEYISTTTLLKKYGLSPSDYDAIPAAILSAKAEYGKAVHKGLELYIKGDETQLLIPEVKAFADWLTSVGMTTLDCVSEQVVFNEYYKIAGTVDLQLWNIVADFKTTATLYLVPVMWQLSIYNFILHPNEEDYNLHELKCFWFNSSGHLTVKDIPLIPYARLLLMLDAYRRGEETWIDSSVPETLIEKVNELVKQKRIIDTLKRNLKILESEKEVIQASVSDQMQEESRIYVDAPMGIVTLTEVVTTRYDNNKIDELIKKLSIAKKDLVKTTAYTRMNIKDKAK